MGIIIRQSTWNLAIIMLGFAIGGLSKFFVMPNILTEDELGKLDLLVYHAMILATIFNFGASNTIVKFFKEYDLQGRSKTLVKSFVLYPLILGIIIAILLFLFPESYGSMVKSTSKNFIVGAMGVLMLITVSQTVFLSLSGVSSSYLKSTFPVFLNELVLRLFLITGVVLYYFEVLTFVHLIVFYGFSFFGIAVLLFLSTRKYILGALGESIKLKTSEWKTTMQFGLFSLLDSGASRLVNVLDILMIGKLMPVKYVGFYTIGMAVSAVVKMSARAINPIASPLIAKAWAENKLHEIKVIYSKSSLNQMILGGLMIVSIWVSIEQIEMLLPQEFRHIKYVVFWLGLGNLLNVSFGVNGNIILNSSGYKMNLYLNSILLGLTYVFNILFIPDYGIEGAAFATFISLALFNVSKFMYILIKWKLQPFSWRHLVVLIIIIISLFIGDNSSQITENGIADLLLKSTFMATAYCGLIYGLKISSDINSNIKRILPF